MVSAILYMGNTLGLTIVSYGQIVFSKNFDRNITVLDEIFSILQPIELGELNFIIQGTFIESIPNDAHVVLNDLKEIVGRSYVYSLEDEKTLTLLTKHLGLDKVLIHSTLDPLLEIEEEMFVLLEYFNGEIAILVTNTGIKDVTITKPQVIENEIVRLIKLYGEYRLIKYESLLSELSNSEFPLVWFLNNKWKRTVFLTPLSQEIIEDDVSLIDDDLDEVPRKEVLDRVGTPVWHGLEENKKIISVFESIKDFTKSGDEEFESTPELDEKKPKSFTFLDTLLAIFVSLVILIFIGSLFINKYDINKSTEVGRNAYYNYLSRMGDYLVKSVEKNKKGELYFTEIFNTFKEFGESYELKTFRFEEGVVVAYLTAESQDSLGDLTNNLTKKLNVLDISVIDQETISGKEVLHLEVMVK